MKKGDYNFYIYITASTTGTLYIGFTNNLLKRITEHRNGKYEGFSKKYGCKKLVYYERYQYVNDALSREKELKKWSRKKKEALIATLNPHWNDLYYDML